MRKKEPPRNGAGCAHLLLFAPDGRRLVAVAGGAAHVIDLESWGCGDAQGAPPETEPRRGRAGESEASEEKASALLERRRERVARVASGARGGRRRPGGFARVRERDARLAVVTTSSGRPGCRRRACTCTTWTRQAARQPASAAGAPRLPPVAATAFSADGGPALALRDNAVVAYDAGAPRWLPGPPRARTRRQQTRSRRCPGRSARSASTPRRIERCSRRRPRPSLRLPRWRTARRGAVSNGAPPRPGAREKPNKRRRRSGAGGSHDGGGESALTHIRRTREDGVPG